MQSLVEDILDLSRIEFNQFKLNISEFYVEDIIKEIFTMVEFQAKQNNINLLFECPYDKLKIKSDPKRLKQIIQNLVSNSLKFTL